MEEPQIQLHYDVLKDDYIRGGEASSKIKKALMQLGVNRDVIKRVCVAAYEAEINIVIHSNGGYIDVAIYDDRIQMFAKDTGPGIENITLAMTEGYSTASEEARCMGFGAGMGLPNIKKNCDEFGIHSEYGQHTEIRMIINFR